MKGAEEKERVEIFLAERASKTLEEKEEGESAHRGGIIAEREGKSARRKSRKPAALRSN